MLYLLKIKYIFTFAIFILSTGCSGPGAVRAVFLADGNEKGKNELYRNIPNVEERGLTRLTNLSDGTEVINHYVGYDHEISGVEKAMEISPDGHFIAYLTPGGFSIRAVSYLGETFLGNSNVSFKFFEYPKQNLKVRLMWSPDSQYIAYSIDGLLYTARGDGSNHRQVSAANLYLFKSKFTQSYVWLNNNILAYVGTNHNGKPSLYAVNATGNNHVELVTPFSWPSHISLNFANDQIAIRKSATLVNDAWIVYLSASDLYTVRIDGTGKRLIHKNVPAQIIQKSGNWILYTSDRQPQTPKMFDLYSYNVETLEKQLIEKNVVLHKIAGNGSRVAYTADRYNNNTNNLYSAALDGTDRRTLIKQIAMGGSVSSIEWAPNNQRIAFIGEVITKGIKMLCTVNPTGDHFVNHTKDVFNNVYFRFNWSPDSKSLVYTFTNNKNIRGKINAYYVVFDTMSDETKSLSNPGYNIIWRQWSPNGRYIAYIVEYDDYDYDLGRNPEDRLFVFDKKSKTSKRITPRGLGVNTNRGEFFFGVKTIQWAPDSRQIVYQAYNHSEYFESQYPPKIQLLSSRIDGRTDNLSGVMDHLSASVKDFRIVDQQGPFGIIDTSGLE